MTQKERFEAIGIQAGHVVRLRNDELRMVLPVGVNGALILLGNHGVWDYLSNWNGDLDCLGDKIAANFRPSALKEAKEKDIIEVYGWIEGTKNYAIYGFISADNRPLLWTRTPPKKMTVSEISEALGYPVEIVAEGGVKGPSVNNYME